MAKSTSKPDSSTEQALEPIDSVTEADPITQIEEMITLERELLEELPDMTVETPVLNQIDLPEIGERFTEVQDTSVFDHLDTFRGQLPHLIPNEYRVSTLPRGSFVSWTAGQPFLRGYSDRIVSLGVVTWHHDGILWAADILLDFDYADIYLGISYELESDGIDSDQAESN